MDESEITLLNEVNNEHGLVLPDLQGGDKEVPLFLAEWLNCGMNASQAYRRLHPDVTEGSARVLGSKKLAKINILAILAAYGIGYDDFFTQLKDGLHSMKWNEFSGEQTADHRLRLEYLKILGKLLGVGQT